MKTFFYILGNIKSIFINGKNIFMSGPAGTGKTFLIKFIKNICNKTHKNCQVTALTGCAALLLNCDAKTIHSWSGIGASDSDDINYVYQKTNKFCSFIVIICALYISVYDSNW